MKLAKVRISNFRCFESLTIPLQPDVNVFVGANAAGKTAILDAIAIALYNIVAANGGGGKRQRGYQEVALKPKDIHVARGAEDPGVIRKDFVRVSAQVRDFYEAPGFCARTDSGAENLIEWTDHIRCTPPKGFSYDTRGTERLAPIYSYFKALWEELRKSDGRALIPFPVVAYYRSARRLCEMPGLGDIFNRVLERVDAYEMALNAGKKYQAMFQWFYLRENAELREKQQIRDNPDFEYPDLSAVRKALIRTLENVERVIFVGSPPNLTVEFKKIEGITHKQSLEQLSDGYRNLLALVFDFARRLAQANPKWENPLEAPGILLIDEIELHLHPRWQQTIIPRLREVFPNTQLIVATHSPQVLTTVESRNILIIRNHELRAAPPASYGAESKRLLERVLNTDSRPPAEDNEFVRKIKKIFELIKDDDLNSAQNMVNELLDETGPEEPVLIEAQTIIENRIWEKELDL